MSQLATFGHFTSEVGKVKQKMNYKAENYYLEWVFNEELVTCSSPKTCLQTVQACNGKGDKVTFNERVLFSYLRSRKHTASKKELAPAKIVPVSQLILN